MKPIIIVHAGAGNIPTSQVMGRINGMKDAIRAGYELLKKGGSSLEAVEAAIVSMEIDEYFNAGYGSTLNLRGEVEMDASIMSGTNLDFGAVALIKDFPHPISIARKVLTDSSHSLLGGEGAKLFALEKGFKAVPPESLITQFAKDALEKYLKYGEFDEGSLGTVGAVAVDANGIVAAGTSTGGMSGKAVGRIGDTPQIGCGTYADDNIGGASCTGYGENILKYGLARSIINLMGTGVDAKTAARNAVNSLTERFNTVAGAITLSNKGDVGVHFSARRMAWAYIKDGKIIYGVEKGQIIEELY